MRIISILLPIANAAAAVAAGVVVAAVVDVGILGYLYVSARQELDSSAFCKHSI